MSYLSLTCHILSSIVPSIHSTTATTLSPSSGFASTPPHMSSASSFISLIPRIESSESAVASIKSFLLVLIAYVLQNFTCYFCRIMPLWRICFTNFLIVLIHVNCFQNFPSFFIVFLYVFIDCSPCSTKHQEW